MKSLSVSINAFNLLIISDLYKKDLDTARRELIKVKSVGDIDCYVCDITKENDIVRGYISNISSVTLGKR